MTSQQQFTITTNRRQISGAGRSFPDVRAGAALSAAVHFTPQTRSKNIKNGVTVGVVLHVAVVVPQWAWLEVPDHRKRVTGSRE